MTDTQQYLYSLPSKLKLFSRELNWLSEILSDTLALSETKGKEAWSSYTEVTKKIVTEDLYQVEDSYRNLMNYTFHFDYIALHSLYTTTYSVFENFILEFGSKIEELSKSKNKISERDSNGEVDRVRKYLYSVHNFKNASDVKKQWNDLIKFHQIRNLIIHNRNKLENKKSNNKHLNPFLKKFDANITKAGEFQIRNEEFVESFKNTAIIFTDSLASDCLKLFKEKKTEAGS